MPTIQKPTKGRIVIYTAESQDADVEGREARHEYAALITGTDHIAFTLIDLVTFGPRSVYFQANVVYDAAGAPNTWRYPDYCKDTIEVP